MIPSLKNAAQETFLRRRLTTHPSHTAKPFRDSSEALISEMLVYAAYSLCLISFDTHLSASTLNRFLRKPAEMA